MRRERSNSRKIMEDSRPSDKPGSHSDMAVRPMGGSVCVSASGCTVNEDLLTWLRAELRRYEEDAPRMGGGVALAAVTNHIEQLKRMINAIEARRGITAGAP